MSEELLEYILKPVSLHCTSVFVGLTGGNLLHKNLIRCSVLATISYTPDCNTTTVTFNKQFSYKINIQENEILETMATMLDL
jgi:hypothetical protein